MLSGDDAFYMARALRLAERGLLTTAPNPRVGCVLLNKGTVVGEGWHAVAGQPHAEINALQQAGSQAAGATAYVTLEPCCHQGRTPPCTDALIAAGVKRVVAAMEDPNPQVAGKGLAALRAAGIDATAGVLAAAAEQLNAGFVMRMRQGRPRVRCKLAMSLDVQQLRARSDAIMTGIGTVLADDPSLTVRLDGMDDSFRQPLRIILDSHLRTPPDAKMLELPGETLIITGAVDADNEARLTRTGIRIVTLPMRNGQLDLAAVLQYLGTLQINELHLEAGATLCGALLQVGLIDEWVIYMAPHLMGDAARGLFALPGLEQMAQRIKLSISDVRAVGDDWRITATVAI